MIQLPFFFLISFCSDNGSIVNEYVSMHNSIFPDEGIVVARQDNIKLTKNNLYYVNNNGRLISSEEILRLNISAKNLVLKKVLLRRIAIQEGIENSIYGTTNAASFIIPRLEKILEDYYYYKTGNYEAINNDIDKLAKNEDDLKNILNSNKTLKDKNIELNDLRQEMSKQLLQIKRLRQIRAREIEITKLLAKYPQAEIYQ